ncbi:uncharacterized protein BX663DRAFT_488552 [Cokeromyces recurvatus]|uniref:uncharacterized protein n=1 Tax=Cokeromyces recurvatus TaxID=90255 RepID=UPI002221081E|nr:uncharacterized protein BX663DRAFT_488552 [Cokeromyces recurvatus]KAI7900353.1 hypothetical protein BX663DRAFT_488552 [Cokeromyces recurvatus]
MTEKNYSAVPPPPSLTSEKSSSIDFNDALLKARAIAEKLKRQSTAGSSSVSSHLSTGTKRSYSDDNSVTTKSSQDDYGSKRSAYDGGSSRPSYDVKESRRYGLGSEERKSSYNSQKQEEYSVPNHLVGLLIGKGGENLKKIERMSGVTKVQFANDPVGNERVVYLYGESDQIAIARDMIRQMVSDAQSNENDRYSGSSNNDQENESSTTIQIPANKVGLVIGRGGETIRDFKKRSKANIIIASDNQHNERMITLIGSESAIQAAKSLIEDIVYGNNNSTTTRNWNANNQQGNNGYSSRIGKSDEEHASINIPVSIVGLIIGRGGETIRSIQDQSGACVKIDTQADPNSTERTVNISGDPNCVSIAKQLIENKIAEANQGRYNSRGYKPQQQEYDQYDESGYDYQQQYNQYYGQYYNDGSSYQQYPEYDNTLSGNDPAQSKDAYPSSGQSKTNDSDEQTNFDYTAYYNQYYNGQQLTPEQQEAYYKWYQQYYGQQQYQADSNNIDGEPITSEEKHAEDK